MESRGSFFFLDPVAPVNHAPLPGISYNFVHKGNKVGDRFAQGGSCALTETRTVQEYIMNTAQMLATLAQMSEASQPQTTNNDDMNRDRFILGDKVELTGTSYFPERINEKGETVPAVYSGWHDNFLFRILGENADAINSIVPAWRQGEVVHPERGGQVVVLGTNPGTSCRWKNPTPEYLGSYALTATHMTGTVDIEAPKAIKFKLASKK